MYPVDLHMHTVASTHAYSTLHDYIAEAKRKGIKLFAITDHGPDMADAPHYWHFVNMCIWPRLVDGVGILRGIESNIKNIEGEIDCSGPMLTSLDLIIAGFHEPVFPPQDRDTHTQAMIAAMASGKVHMISHPGNPKFPVDIPAIAEAAARYQVALEINNSSFVSSRVGSEDNCRAIAAAVRDAGDGWRWARTLTPPLPSGSLPNAARSLMRSISRRTGSSTFLRVACLTSSSRGACRRSRNLLTFNLYNWNN